MTFSTTSGARKRRRELPEGVSAEDAKKKKTQLPPGSSMPPGIGETSSNKEALNALCMKILSGALQKGQIVYDTQQVETVEFPRGLGFQSTCSIPCLPGKSSTMIFTGKVCQVKKDAEHSAAGYALA